VRAWREKANTARAVSWTATGVGAGAAIAGVALLGVGAAEDPEGFFTTPTGQLAMGLTGAGGIIVGAAFYAWTLLGPEPLNSHELVFDPESDARPAAEAANARLSGTPVTPTE
jgi:hypothetical protein